MAILFLEKLPPAATLDMVKEVGVAANVHDDPPPGLVLHTAYVDEGRVCIADVWESQQHLEDFQKTRLSPATGKVIAANGIDPSTMAEVELKVFEVDDLVRGRRPVTIARHDLAP